MDDLAARKVRSDAWGEALDEETRFAIYNLTKPPREGEERVYLSSFEDALTYLSDHHPSLPPPSRAGWYRFLARCRAEDQKKLIYRVACSTGAARDLNGEAKIDSAAAGEAFRALAVDAAMSGDERAAQLYASAASIFLSNAQRREELALKDRAQTVKEEELKLAQKKLVLLERREAAARETVGDRKLSTEAKLAKMKEIFG